MQACCQTSASAVVAAQSNGALKHDETFRLLRQAGVAAVRPLEGAPVLIRPERDGGLDASLLARLIGTQTVYLQDVQSGVYLQARKAEAGHAYILHSSPLTALNAPQLKSLQPDNLQAAATLPIGTVDNLKSMVARSGVSYSTASQGQQKSCCLKAPKKVKEERPGWTCQLRGFLKLAYPKWSTDPTLRQRMKDAVAYLDSKSIFAFEDIMKMGSDAFCQLDLPLGLRTTLVEGLLDWCESGFEMVLPSNVVALRNRCAEEYMVFIEQCKEGRSSFSSWDSDDLRMALEVKDKLDGITNASFDPADAIRKAQELVREGEDCGTVRWALHAHLGKNPIAKALDLRIYELECDAPFDDTSMMEEYLERGSENGNRDLGDESSVWWDLFPLLFDQGLAVHHTIWHVKYVEAVQNPDEGEYFFYMHWQLLALFKQWLAAFPNAEKCFCSTKELKYLPAWRGSVGFHMNGNWHRGKKDPQPIPFRTDKSPVVGEIIYPKELHIVLQACKFDEDLKKKIKQNVPRLPTEDELKELKKTNSVLYKSFVSPTFEGGEKNVLAAWREMIKKALEDGELPVEAASVDKNKKPKTFKLKDNPEGLKFVINIMGGMISEVWATAMRDRPTDKVVKDSLCRLWRFHQHYHVHGGPSMGPEYFNVKDPLFYMWHEETDEIRRALVAMDKTDALQAEGCVKTNELIISDVVLLEHKDCTTPEDLSMPIDDEKYPKKLKLGSFPEDKDQEVKKIMEWNKNDWTHKGTKDVAFGKNTIRQMVVLGSPLAKTAAFEPAKVGFVPFVMYIRIKAPKKVKNSCFVTVRLFIAPESKMDNNECWLELDRFTSELVGKKDHWVIRRSILESNVIMKKSLFDTDQESIFGRTYESCDCGWPWNLIIPYGHPKGANYKMFAMITDTVEDRNQDVSFENPKYSTTMCFGKGKGSPDKKPMGYPFSANIGQMSKLKLKDHMHIKDIKIVSTKIIAKEKNKDGPARMKQLSDAMISSKQEYMDKSHLTNDKRAQEDFIDQKTKDPNDKFHSTTEYYVPKAVKKILGPHKPVKPTARNSEDALNCSFDSIAQLRQKLLKQIGSEKELNDLLKNLEMMEKNKSKNDKRNKDQCAVM